MVLEISQAPESPHALEETHEWLRAAELYKSALRLVPENKPWTQGEIHEKIGYTMYRAARQAQTTPEFKERMDNAISAYDSAKRLYQGEDLANTGGRVSRCIAMIAFLTSWLSPEGDEKRRLLTQTWESTRDALEKFDRRGEKEQYWMTYSQTALAASLAREFEWTRSGREMIIRHSVECGEKAIEYLLRKGDNRETAKAYALAVHWLPFLSDFLEPAEREENMRKARNCWAKAAQISEEAALVELSPFEAILEWLGTDQALALWNTAMGYCTKTRDQLVIGGATSHIMYLTHWKAASAEDEDQGKEFLSKALEYALETNERYKPTGYMSPFFVPWPRAPHAYFYMSMAKYCESDPGKKRELIQKGLASCLGYLDLATKFASPGILTNAHHTYAILLLLAGRFSQDATESRKHLAAAFEHENEALKINENLSLFGYWGVGIGKNVLAGIKSELAELSADAGERRSFLLDAIREKEESVRLCAKEVALLERENPISMMGSVAHSQYEYGNLLSTFFELSEDTDHLRKAADAFWNASERFRRIGALYREAECHWKLGLVHDGLGDHLKSSEEFLLASQNYSKAAEKAPGLRLVYNDCAKYMEAWSNVSKAKYHHEREEYSQAKDRYSDAAFLHTQTRTWRYLATNYSAWAKLEEAEDLSRKGEADAAASAFNQASRLFVSSRGILEKQLDVSTEPEEKKMVSQLSGATAFRTQYCQARLLLEEARSVEGEGDYIAATRKFEESSRAFDEIGRRLESDEEQKEIKLISRLVKAWQMMSRAEAEASPKLYLEASELFEEAEGLASLAKTKMLALGHSRFCKALELAARLADTRDPALYFTARQHLEAAAEYYSKSSLASVSEHAKATKLLLEAYMFMIEATNEREQEQRGRLYRLAEKVLEASAVSFANSGQSKRREEALKLLEKVREEKELAGALALLLRTPLAMSATEAFTVPKPTFEQAVGLERFEEADIRADFNLTRRSLRVGERVEIGIDMVNAGKGLALLVKIDNAVPSGFEVVEAPDKYGLKDGSLEMRGKRLGPLKTEEVRMVVQPRVQGISALAPEIKYLDESGNYKTYKPDSIDIVVKEPHLPAWLSGPGQIRVPSELRFESERTRAVFQQLAMAFQEDYVVKGLFVDKAGWRSFMQIIRNCRLPRSAFYGHEGRKGPVLTELESLGLIESRVFSEERGRGGDITKLRIAYETVILKSPQ